MALKDELVFRLRGPHGNPLMTTEPDEISRLQGLCREAADETERLTRELAECRADAAVVNSYRNGLVIDKRRLEAENERLRAALKNAEQHLDCAISGTSSREMIVNDARHTLVHVREALGAFEQNAPPLGASMDSDR